MRTLIKNGTIVTTEGEFIADLLIENGKISQIGNNIPASDAEQIDARDKYVLPGGVDQHVHFSFEFKGARVKGFEHSNAAAIGGTTTVIEFVNQEKGKGLIESIDKYKAEFAEGIAMVDYAFHGVATESNEQLWKDIPNLPEAGYPTMKLFMAYKGLPIHADDEMILKSMQLAKECGVTIMTHCENADLINLLQQQLVDQGKVEPYGHVLSRPPLVEVEATERAISIAKLAEAPLFIVHVTTKGAVDAIKKARSEGYPIFGETCTHYLLLDKENLAKANFEGAKYVCSPALRDEADRNYLWKSIRNNWLQVVSSDHCGFDFATDKHLGKDDFRDIPNGAPGLENRLGLLWTYGVEKGRISRQDLVRLFSTAPAKVNGIDYVKGSLEVGKDADVVIYNPQGEYTISAESSLQGTDYNSFEGFVQKGRVETVFLRGQKIVDDSTFVGEQGQGNFIKGKPFGLAYH